MDSYVTLSLSDYDKLLIQNHDTTSKNEELANECFKENLRANCYFAKYKFASYLISLMATPNVPASNVNEYALASVIGKAVRHKNTEFVSHEGKDLVIHPEEVNYVLNICQNNHNEIRGLIERLREKYPKLIDIEDDYVIDECDPEMYWGGFVIHDTRPW